MASSSVSSFSSSLPAVSYDVLVSWSVATSDVVCFFVNINGLQFELIRN